MIKIVPNPQLQASIEAQGNNLRDSANALAAEVAVEVRWRVAMRTPVDKGVARGNWRLGINAPDLTADLNVRDPDGVQGDTAAQTAARAIKAGDVIHITNSLDYVPALNGGSSKKAPAGFVELTAAEIPFIVRELAQRWGERLHGTGPSWFEGLNR